MDSQIKERIVGAAVLVALGVWLIPWVLDGSDSSETDTAIEVDLDLPAAHEQAPVRTETIELEPSPAAVVSTAREVDSPEATTEAAAETATEAGSDAGAAQEAAVGQGSVVADGGADGGADSDTVAADAGAPQTPPPAVEPQPSPAAAAPASAAPEPGTWLVQLGAFSEIANARQLVSRVATYGHRAHIAEIRTAAGTMHRVRIDGFASRNEAEGVASALAAHGFVPRVQPPE